MPPSSTTTNTLTSTSPPSPSSSSPIPSADTEIELSKYGLGTQRSLVDYSHMCGVDFNNRRITNAAKSGNLQTSEFVDPVLDMVMKASPLVPLAS